MDTMFFTALPYLLGEPWFPMPPRAGGWTPELWGQSRACAQMVRKNKIRRARK